MPNPPSRRPTAPPTSLVGQRVVLEPHRLDRAPAMFALVEADRDRRGAWLPWVESTLTVADERSYIRHTQETWKDGSLYDFGILRGGDHMYCGNVGVHHLRWAHGCCELGYWIGGAFEGQGYVTEAVMLVEQAMFDAGMHRIEIRCDPRNLRSVAVAERLGYTLEGTLRDQLWRDGGWRDTMVFAKLAAESTT
jgi:ribosomal-protein-serine acetyltransferase